MLNGRSTSRAIVSRETVARSPRRRSIFIESLDSSPAPPPLSPLPAARFYRRYSTWCGKRFGWTVAWTSEGWVRAPLASRRSKTLCSPGGVGRRRINQDRQLCKWLQTLPLFPVPAFYSAALIHYDDAKTQPPPSSSYDNALDIATRLSWDFG